MSEIIFSKVKIGLEIYFFLKRIRSIGNFFEKIYPHGNVEAIQNKRFFFINDIQIIIKL